MRTGRRSGSVSLPAPMTLGAIAWWDPSVGITLNGSKVSAWRDRIGGNVLSQGTAPLQPAYANGALVVNLAEWMATAATNPVGVAVGGTYTALAIIAPAETTLAYRTPFGAFADAASVRHHVVYYRQGPGETDALLASTVNASGEALLYNYAPNAHIDGLVSVTAASGVGGTFELYENSTQLKSGAASVAAVPSTRFGIGATLVNSVASLQMDGAIHDVVVFDRKLSASELATLHAWAAARKAEISAKLVVG